jgi:hypothetical protein
VCSDQVLGSILKLCRCMLCLQGVVRDVLQCGCSKRPSDAHMLTMALVALAPAVALLVHVCLSQRGHAARITLLLLQSAKLNGNSCRDNQCSLCPACEYPISSFRHFHDMPVETFSASRRTHPCFSHSMDELHAKSCCRPLIEIPMLLVESRG